MKIRLWRGYHSPALLESLRSALEGEGLLIACPPYLESFEFCAHLPAGEIELIGEWGELKAPTQTQRVEYSERPVLGVFTSGTVTGRPRLVLYTKANIEASLDAILDLFDRNRIEQIFCYAQPFHTFGLLLGYVLSLKLGCELIAPLGKYSSESHARRVQLSNPNVLTLGTPAHFHDLVAHVRSKQIQISSSYSSIAGGASVSGRLWREMRDVLKIEAPSIGYGCTEASPGITHLPPGLEPRADGEIGFLLPNLRTEVSEECVEISGPSLCLATIDASGVSFLATRKILDRLERSDDGRFLFLGRSDLVINRGGQKFSPETLEASVSAALGTETLCVALPEDRLGEDIGFLVKGEVAPVREHLAKKFQLRLDPARFLSVAEFPRNPSFKPDRQQAAAFFETPLLLPISTAMLKRCLPHRPPMVWIDEVTAFGPDGGVARVTLRKSAHYMSPQGLRPSAIVEFVAQAFGYIMASYSLSLPLAERQVVSNAFLVGVRNADLGGLNEHGPLLDGAQLTIRVGNLKRIGPMQIVDGFVSLESGEPLASVNLKLYSD